MEFLHGRIFHDPGFPGLTPSERYACWESAIETLSTLHSVDFLAAGLENYGKTTGFYQRQIKTLSTISKSQAEAKDVETGELTGEIPHIKEIVDYYKSNIPEERCSIVHGDFKIDNLVFHSTQCRVIGILDWELSTIGHPLSDLCNLLQPFSIPYNGAVLSFHGFLDAPLSVYPNLPQLESLHALYSQQSNFDPRSAWTFGSSFALFRVS